MPLRISVAIVLVGTPQLWADIFAYEATVFPDQAGFDVVQIVCQPALSVNGGFFIQHVELCEGFPPPGGQEAAYRRLLDDFIGEEDFFVEWRVESDADQSELPWGGGGALAAGSQGGVNYLASIADDQVELWRDNLLPILFIDIEPGVPHTYRLELHGADLYIWYIDGVIVDSGVPQGPYPSFNPKLTWRAKAAWLPNTTSWDYIRYGTIPADGTGDFDSDGLVQLDDYYFVEECLLGPDIDAGPGISHAPF